MEVNLVDSNFVLKLNKEIISFKVNHIFVLRSEEVV